MSKKFVEVKLRKNPRAFRLQDREEFLVAVKPYGWVEVESDAYDVVVESDSGFLVEMLHGEYLVLYEDRHGNYWEGEPFSPEDFEERFITL